MNYKFLDSLVANEFAVEINGESTMGVFRVLGFTPYHVDANQPKQVTITKMVQRDVNSPFNKWLRESETSGTAATRDMAIIAIDDGMETRRWTLKGAYIISVSYSDFDSSSIEMVEERITVGYTSVDHRWSASGE